MKDRFFLHILFGLVAAFLVAPAAFAAAPTVSSFSPANGVGGVARNPTLVIVFNQTVIASGSTLATPSKITIYRSDGTVAEAITASGSRVTVSTTTATITPTVTLGKGITYYVQIAAQAFVNASDESYAGISDATTWRFTTIGGGAGQHKQIIERLRESEPAHYNMEAPCMADVGIFVPGQTCGSTTEDATLSPAAPEEPVAAKKVINTKDNYKKTVSPELEEARQKRAERLLKAMDSLAGQSHAAPVAQSDSLQQERICARVESRFSGNSKMIDRVNVRLEKQFGWTCGQ